MENDYLKGLLEEVLYVYSNPIDLEDIAKILYDFDKKEIQLALDQMRERSLNRKSGLILNKYDDRYQFVTRSENDKYFEKIIQKTERKLSTSTMETLSIIAYKQPVTRAEIDKIRGVNSQSSIDNLLDKGLIMENGRLEKIGKPIIYITTNEFLRYFNLESLENLPEISLRDDIYED